MRFILLLGITVMVVLLVVMLTGPTMLIAATTPSLGEAASFAILSSTYTNTVSGTTINGDLGYTTGPDMAPTVNGAIFITPTQAGADQNSALTALNIQAPTFSYPSGAIDLATDTRTPSGTGVFTPGVYVIDGAATIGTGGTGGITLKGAGTYIFRITGALNTVAGSIITLTEGASPNDVFWTPVEATTLGANSTFIGTDIDDAGITIGSTVTWTGRALAYNGTVSTAADTITNEPVTAPATISLTKTANPTSITQGVTSTITYTYTVTNTGDGGLTGVNVLDTPIGAITLGATTLASGASTTGTAEITVTPADTSDIYNLAVATGTPSVGGSDVTANAEVTVTVTAPPPSDTATLHVIKHVINDNGGTAVAANFNLHVKTSGTDVSTSPAPGGESPGTTYTLAPGTYVVSEDAFAGYTASYSGDSDSSGNITLDYGDNKTVTITNNDIATTPGGPTETTGVAETIEGPTETTEVAAETKEAAAVTTTATGGQLPKTSTPNYQATLPFSGMDPVIPISGGSAIIVGLSILLATLRKKHEKKGKHVMRRIKQ